MNTQRFAIIVLSVVVCLSHAPAAQQDENWLPAHVGDEWTYAHEFSHGEVTGEANAIRHRWTTGERTVQVASIPEGVMITKRTVVIGAPPVNEDQWLRSIRNDWHVLLHGGCAYILDGPYALEDRAALDATNRLQPSFRKRLLANDIPQDICAPLSVGKTWGLMASTSPAREDVWVVKDVARNDADALDHGETFHLSSFLGAGTTIDRSFEPGVGIIKENLIHHGTYDATERRLVSFVKGTRQ